MSTLPVTVDRELALTINLKQRLINNNPHSSVLKSKHSILKAKCYKILKRKLKKYKLRRDGKEDPEVIDVSETLRSLLNVKCSTSENKVVYPEDRPMNYLLKMGRRQNILKKRETNVEPNPIDNRMESSPILEGQKDKKHTNAFKLMMDSRNKSMGGNSPGKEKPNENPETLEVLIKKESKAKRVLALQKMAEAKGSLKKKELEENQDEIINKKMEKRAERLKSMITNAKLKEKPTSRLTTIKATETKTKNKKPVENPLKLIDIFNEPIKASRERKLVCKEDEEFLKKLSPSMRKKENMLSYFKKVDRTSEQEDIDLLDENSDNGGSPIIKIKLPSKVKKIKKKKISLSRNVHAVCEDQPLTNDIENESKSKLEKLDIPKNQKEEDNPMEKRELIKAKNKTKIKDKIEKGDVLKVQEDSRPKRNVKRPVKYDDDVALSSSDEELHIFTPKKKKLNENKLKSISGNNNISENIEVEIKKKQKSSYDKKVIEKASAPKKTLKIAPIFNTKPQLDPAALEAKQKFLQSGVPEKLKKIIAKQNSVDDASDIYFPVVVHIQQNDFSSEVSNEIKSIICASETSDIEDDVPIKYEDGALKKLLDIKEEESSNLSLQSNAQTALQYIKQVYPKFPVYRTYQLLKGKSKGEFKDSGFVEFDNSIEVINDLVDVNNEYPDRLTWSAKYKPLSTRQIIGNFESIKELRKWLVLWTENEARSKNKKGCDSDSSDFYQSDTDSRDSMKASNNLLVITGPVGSGKTSSVYAAAAELSFKVIEVNASSKRTGKIMLQDLSEATQSHKVNRGHGPKENAPKIIEIEAGPEKVKKRGRPKKVIEKVVKKIPLAKKIDLNETPSQESARTGMSLILIDDADVVFDQDDGFCSAITQLVHSSKRPVILVTSSLSCPHLQKYLQCGNILTMNPLQPKMLGTWLDIMCLADTKSCLPGMGSKCLDYFQGDIRKTINYLHFYMASQVSIFSTDSEPVSQNCNMKMNYDDENSGMSWVDREDDKNGTDFFSAEDNIHKQAYENLFQHKDSSKLYNIWWSLPKILHISETKAESQDLFANSGRKDEEYKKIEAFARAVDCISWTDSLSKMKTYGHRDITCKPWQSVESDSVCETENFDMFDECHEVSLDISEAIMTMSIEEAQQYLECDSRPNIEFPGMSKQRERDRVVDRHNSLSSYLNPSSVLDRRAVALDYWPACRSICRTERSKTDNKRNNRFCHYLKSLSILCKSDSFDKLGDSLVSNEKNS